MNKGDILKKYGEFYDPIQRLGLRIGLNFTPKIKYLELTDAQIQSAYREKKKGFKGDIIEYLCYLSMLHLESCRGDTDLITFIKTCLEGNENEEIQRELKADAINFLRLFMKKPLFYFFTIVNKLPNRNTFTELAGLYFDHLIFLAGG